MSAKFPARGFLAKRASDGLWLRRVDRAPKPTAAAFAAEVAARLGVPVESLTVGEGSDRLVVLWRGKPVETVKWKTAAEFAAEVAAEFGIPQTAITVVETLFQDAADQDTVTAALNAGSYQGIGVVAPTVPSVPDVQGVITDVMAAFTRGRLNQVGKEYPFAFAALTRGDFAGFKADVDDAFAKTVITLAEKDLLYAKAKARKIPGF